MTDFLINPFSPLRHVHARASGRIAFKKGGSQEQTVIQQNVPKEFMPYLERGLIRAEELSLQPYQQYGGQRISGPSQDTTNAYNAIRNMQGAGQQQIGFAQNMAAQNAMAGRQIAGRDNPFQFSAANFTDAGTFNNAAAQQYMDPYLQSVLGEQKRALVEDYNIAQADRNAAAVGAGAFGGSRQAVMEGMAQRDLLNRQAQVDAEGRQEAFRRAAEQFGLDRSARFTVEGARAGELGRVQSGQAAENRAAGMFDLDALRFSGDSANMLAELGQMGRGNMIQDAQLLEGIGKSQEARQQAGLDMAYQDFLRQQGWGWDQLNNFNSVLRGLPIAPSGTQVTSQSYNPLSQLLGAGIAGLGLYNGMRG